MDARRYDTYRELFAHVDVKDPKSLRKWFDDHPYLSVYDHAQIMQKCTLVIREYRKKAGIMKKGPTTSKRYYPGATIGPSEVPKDWRNPEWLIENLKKYTASALIRSIGVNRPNFYKALKKANIPLGKGNYSRNPCCTKSWCHKHYIELQMSMEECSKLAGVSRPKFADWLVKFDIPIRHKPQEIKAKTALPLKIKRLIHRLKQQKVVKSVNVLKTYLCVEYLDNKKIRYLFNKLAADQWSLERVPKMQEQYERSLLSGDGYPAHFIVPRKDLANLTVFEKDVVLHSINYHFRRRRHWIWPTLPDHVIDEDLKALKSIKDKSFVKRGSLTVLSTKGPGRHLMMQFFTLQYLYRRVFINTDRMMVNLHSLWRTKKDLSYFNIIKHLTKGFCGYKFKWPSPAIYMALLRKLGVNGSVLDITVGSGARAIACATLGLKYLSLPSSRYDLALKHGFQTFFNIETAVWNGKEIVDCVLCDADLMMDNLELALSFADRARRIVAYVSRDVKEEYAKRLKPKTIIPIVTQFMNQQPNFFFIW